jgi:hypothetical protein
VSRYNLAETQQEGPRRAKPHKIPPSLKYKSPPVAQGGLPVAENAPGRPQKGALPMEVVEDLGFAENAAFRRARSMRNQGVPMLQTSRACSVGSDRSARPHRRYARRLHCETGGLSVAGWSETGHFRPPLRQAGRRPMRGADEHTECVRPATETSAKRENEGRAKGLRPFEPERREVSLRSTSHTTGKRKRKEKGGKVGTTGFEPV